MQGYRFKNSLDFGKKKLAHKEPISSQGWYHVRSQAFSHNSLSNAPNREEQTKGISVIIVITLCAIICRCDSFVAVEYLGHEREEIKRNSIQMLLSISQSLQTATLHILRLKKGMGVWRRANTGSALILGGLRSQTVGKA